MSCFLSRSVAIWGARCLLFGILGLHFRIPGAPWETVLPLREHLGEPFWHPWEAILAPRDHPGRPWELQDGHEVANNRIFVDLGMISGHVSVSFGVQNA